VDLRGIPMYPKAILMAKGRAYWWHWRARTCGARGRYNPALMYAHWAVITLDEFSDRPTAFRRRVLQTLSDIYADLADHEGSDWALRRMLATIPDEPDNRCDGLAAVLVLTQLGNLARLRARYDEAEVYLRRALMIGSSLPDGAVAVTFARNALAITFKDTARYHDAALLYGEVLVEVKARFGSRSAAAATCFHNLAGLAYAQGDHQRAKTLAVRAIRVRTRAFGKDHPDVAADLVVLAASQLGSGKLDDAEITYQEALAIYTRVFGVRHYEVAVVLNGLATIELQRARPDQAIPLYVRALVIKERTLGQDHPEIGVLLNNIAVSHRQAGHLQEATESYQRALPILTNGLGSSHPASVACEENVVMLRQQLAIRTASPADAAGFSFG
jgi:tetratricopeptide (TPR) repeat protein